MLAAEATAQTRLARHNALRSAILEAGRKLAIREGVANLSLSSAAAEAGLNPSVVFGQFHNKDELVLAIVAGDLDLLAAAMRERCDPAAAPRFSSGPAGAPAEEAPGSVLLAPGNGSPDHSGVYSGTDLQKLFDRIEDAERQMKDVLATLTQRVEEAEHRQRTTTSELRVAINDVATRLEIAESARQLGGPSSETEATPQYVLTGACDVETGKSAGQPDKAGYREAADRAASAAAALVAIEEQSPLIKKDPWHLSLQNLTRPQRRSWLLAVGMVLLTFAVGGATAFSIGKVRGRDLELALLRTEPSQRPHVALAGKIAPVVQKRAKAALAEGTRDPAAELLAGLQYFRGQGVVPDHSRAARLLRDAAERGQPVAQYWLGNLYEHGDGVQQSPTEAVRWYTEAASKGNRKAMHALGIAYAQASGPQRDYAKAAVWFGKAAQLGLVNSQFNLGVLYERGLGVPQSLTKAYRWYAIAAAQSDEESRARIEALRTQLNPDELARAEKEAAAFHPTAVLSAANDLPPPPTLYRRS